MVLMPDLKTRVEVGTAPEFLIFLCKGSTLLAEHYLREISYRNSTKIQYIDNIEDLCANNLFSLETNEFMKVFLCEKLKETPLGAKGYIICKSIDKNVDLDCVCEVPSLEEWQLKDYLFSLCEGADENDLEYIFSHLKKLPERLVTQAEQINMFTQEERKFLVKDMIRSGVFSDVSSETIYTLSNALCTKDLQAVAKILSEISSIDIEPVGLATVMTNNFRNLLLIQGNPAPTPEKTGLPAKQFYAISRNTGHYTISQIMHILKELDSIDVKLKSGDLPVEWIIPYIINLILSTK